MKGTETTSTPLEAQTAPTSLKGKTWVVKEACDVSVLNLIQKYSVPEIIGRLITQRCPEGESIDQFLSLKIKDYFQDPFSIKDMDLAVNRICTALQEGEKIGILGDYDVDGATSTALFMKYFSALGGQVTYYIPDRIQEGYGPSQKGVDFFADNEISLIITVDCGTAAHDVLAYAEQKKIDVVVVDHHIPESALPNATAIVNPNRVDDTSQLGHLCAAGVSFFVLAALQKKLDPLSKKINLLSLLDLVALGTVCDVVPLKTINKAFVAQGLKIMQKGLNLGIQTLLSTLSVTPPLTEYHLGFVLGPHINAGGRIGLSTLGAELLSTDNPERALSIARELIQLNTERKETEKKMIEEAIEMAAPYQDDPLLCLALDGWHPGIIGIIASRVKEKFGKPTFIIGFDEDGLGKGSGRSIKGINLGNLVQHSKKSGLLINGGGHEMAAGLTVKKEKLEEVRRFFNENIDRNVGPQTSYIDSTLSISGINFDLIDWIEKMGPFGAANPQPFFMVPNCTLQNPQIRGKKHVSFRLRGEEGKMIEGIAFNVIGGPLETAFWEKEKKIHAIGRVQIDVWQGRKKLKFLLEDLIQNPA